MSSEHRFLLIFIHKKRSSCLFFTHCKIALSSFHAVFFFFFLQVNFFLFSLSHLPYCTHEKNKLNPGTAPPLARKGTAFRVVDLPVAVPVPVVVIVVVVVPSAPARRGGLGLCRCGGAYRRKGKEPVLDLEAAAGALLEGVFRGEEAVQALRGGGRF